MSAGIFDTVVPAAAAFACVLAVGFAVKWMDDFMDRALDAQGGAQTWAGRLGDGIMPYAMAALCVALLLDAKVAGTLFLSAYALGMAHDGTRRLPSGLRAWQEGLLAVAAGALLAGAGRMAASLAIITFTQCFDDLADEDEDRRRGRRSLVSALGGVEAGLLGTAGLLAAAALDPLTTVYVLWGTAVILSLKPRGIRT